MPEQEEPIAEIRATGTIEDGIVNVILDTPGAEIEVTYRNDEAGHQALGLLFNSFPNALEQVLANMKEIE